jgi:hypothetical protein
MLKRFIDQLHTRLGTRSNYRATANLHNSQITTSPAKPLPTCCSFTSSSLETVSNSGDFSASVAQILPSQPSMQNSIQLNAPSVLVIISRHGPHRKHHSSIVAFVYFDAGTCLPSFCPKRSLLISLSRSRCIVRLYTLSLQVSLLKCFSKETFGFSSLF